MRVSLPHLLKDALLGVELLVRLPGEAHKGDALPHRTARGGLQQLHLNTGGCNASATNPIQICIKVKAVFDCYRQGQTLPQPHFPPPIHSHHHLAHLFPVHA